MEHVHHVTRRVERERAVEAGGDDASRLRSDAEQTHRVEHETLDEEHVAPKASHRQLVLQRREQQPTGFSSDGLPDYATHITGSWDTTFSVKSAGQYPGHEINKFRKVESIQDQ